MKKLLILSLFLVACQKQAGIPSDATEGEIQMAEMMGITVKELRNQTPEEHMMAMQKMMEGGMHHGDAMEGFLAAKGINISSLPVAEEPKVYEVVDGDAIDLNPTLVQIGRAHV